ncbi:MAG: potassium channel family protein [Candidatus Pacearchaeota archaeon]|nr:potassium channel family protein [Candidatus Pacearchaeota archaeon]
MLVTVSILIVIVISLSIGFLIGRKYPEETYLPIFINGLSPGVDDGQGEDNKGTRVGVFDLEKEKGKPGRQILLCYADTNGEVKGKISTKYIGKKIKIVIRDVAYHFIDTEQEVTTQGLHYTAKLTKDRVYSGPPSNPEVYEKWNTEFEYVKAQKTMHQRLADAGDKLGSIPPIAWGGAYLGLIIIFALLYTINISGLKISYEEENIFFVFLHMVYFSIVTITTLGYGDITPTDAVNQLLVGLESISGIIILGLFLNSIVRKKF